MDLVKKKLPIDSPMFSGGNDRLSFTACNLYRPGEAKTQYEASYFQLFDVPVSSLCHKFHEKLNCIICIVQFTAETPFDNTSMFAIYDGHGGNYFVLFDI